MKVVTVVGARPQFIKAVPVQRALQAYSDVEHTLVHTGQHFDPTMSKVFFDQLGLDPPGHHLDIRSSLHGEMTGLMLAAIEPVLLDLRPDWVIVYGDTNSTLAGALAAAKLPCRLAHIEAGLRSFNRTMPEEHNRVVADHLSDLCFAPTDVAVENLRAEGVRDEMLVRTGDVMFDCVRLFCAASPPLEAVLGPLGLGMANGFVLATIHRAENTDDSTRLEAIVEALETTAATVPVVLPVHPRTAAALERAGLRWKDVRAIPPVGYLEMLTLEREATLVVTDSGGVQKEAFFQGTPCVTVRTETEWSELVALGWNRLADPGDGAQIVKAIGEAMASGGGGHAQPYGDGHTAEQIVGALIDR